jgi:hypothetical protein
MELAGEQQQLAGAFLDEARRALDRVLRLDPGERGHTWRQQHLDAMTYWARAYRHYRACHGAQHRITIHHAA